MEYLNYFGASFEEDKLLLVRVKELFNGTLLVSNEILKFDSIDKAVQLAKYINHEDPLARITIDEPNQIVSNTVIRNRVEEFGCNYWMEPRQQDVILTKSIYLDENTPTAGYQNLKSELLCRYADLLTRNQIVVPDKLYKLCPVYREETDENGNKKIIYRPNTKFPGVFRALLCTLTNFNLIELHDTTPRKPFCSRKSILKEAQKGYKERRKKFVSESKSPEVFKEEFKKILNSLEENLTTDIISDFRHYESIFNELVANQKEKEQRVYKIRNYDKFGNRKDIPRTFKAPKKFWEEVEECEGIVAKIHEIIKSYPQESGEQTT